MEWPHCSRFDKTEGILIPMSVFISGLYLIQFIPIIDTLANAHHGYDRAQVFVQGGINQILLPT